MPNKGMSRVGAAIASLTMCAVMAGPAQALTDTAVDMSGRNVSFDTIFVNQPADDIGAMPDNPSMELPDEVSEDLPDDAVVVSPDLAVTEEGKIKDLETGETVTTEELVGTPDTQPDPLAKTNGESFIPVEVCEVKKAVKESEQTSSESGQTGGEAAAVRPIALEGNEYGAYWGTYNNTPAFFESDGTLFVQQAKGVIDVSEWQGEIDWEAAKNAGVEGAIIRISYGWNNGFDKYALRNISECKRLGIPFGIYSYSYSYDKATATAEGADIVSLLRKAGVSPNDLSYPVFYDLERWTWTGYTPPTDPAVYDEIVNAWYGQLQAAGYNNLSVYSYTSYLYGPLNSDNIHRKTRWVASYGQRTGFEYTSNNRGWQYTSGGTVAGIMGRVDLNAFGNAQPVDSDTAKNAVYRLFKPETGLHHYSASYDEVTFLSAKGWISEGVVFYQVSSGAPIFRLYNEKTGNHVYTADENERDVLSRSGWNYEGIGWYVPVAGNYPVYRLYNPRTGEHLFSTSDEEYAFLGESGVWKQEGIAWMGQ